VCTHHKTTNTNLLVCACSLPLYKTTCTILNYMCVCACSLAPGKTTSTNLLVCVCLLTSTGQDDTYLFYCVCLPLYNLNRSLKWCRTTSWQTSPPPRTLSSL